MAQELPTEETSQEALQPDSQQFLDSLLLGSPRAINTVLPSQDSQVLWAIIYGFYRAFSGNQFSASYNEEDHASSYLARLPDSSGLLTDFLLYAIGVSSLIDWPHGFFQLLNIYQHRNKRQITHIVKKDLGHLYNMCLTRSWQGDAFQFVQDAFEQYLLSHYSASVSMITMKTQRQSKQLLENLPYTTVQGAAELTGLHYNMIPQIVEAGLISPVASYSYEHKKFVFFKKSDLLELRQKLQAELTLEQTISRLGISREVVLNLVEKGLLTPLRGPTVGGGNIWYLQGTSVEDFFQSISGNVKPVQDKNDCYIPLHDAVGNFVTIVELFTLLANHKLSAYAAELPLIRLDALLFSRQDIISFRRNKICQLNLIPLKAAARQWLHVAPKSLETWTDTGLVDSIIDAKDRHYFTIEALEEFKTTYVNADQAAHLLHISLSTIRAWTKRGELQAVAGPLLGTARYLYLRQHLEEWLTQNISFEETRELLKVGELTIRAWMKSGQLEPRSKGYVSPIFTRQEVEQLKQELEEREFSAHTLIESEKDPMSRDTPRNFVGCLWDFLNCEDQNGGYLITVNPIGASLSSCPYCGHSKVERAGQFWTIVLDLPLNGKRTHLRVRRQQVYCPACNCYFSDPMNIPNCSGKYTDRLLAFIRAQGALRSFTSISQEVGLTAQTISYIYRGITRTKHSNSNS